MIEYEELLNRSIAIINCIHQFVKNHSGRENKFQNEEPTQIQNSGLLLDFVVTVYEKIMMAHRSFIESQVGQPIECKGKASSSQNINSHRNLNKETEHKFNMLYGFNTLAINIISMLYRTAESLASEEQKVYELNTLLTLHQIFLNQFNFPNQET